MSSSQDTMFSTPIPFRDVEEPSHKKTVEALIRVFGLRHIKIDNDAASLLVNEAGGDQLDNRIIDEFYHLIQDGDLSHISFNIAKQLLSKIKPTITVSPTKILNVFRDVPREIWDLQQQKLIPDYIRPTLLPETSDFQAAELQRYYRAIQRLKKCKKVRWWSESSSVAPVLTEERITIRPVECAMGIIGHQSVVGVLSREYDRFSDGQTKWFLSDTLQKIELDFSECVIRGLFLNSNIVIVSGMIDQDSKLKVQDICHPSNDGNDDSRDTQITTISGMNKLKDVWAIFGQCHLDNGNVLSQIFSVINSEPNLSGIILTGEFSSQSSDHRDQYRSGFSDLFDTIRMCKDKLNGKRVVLIPGVKDPGVQFTPKLPLDQSMIGTDVPDFCEIVLASNPARFESLKVVPQPGRTGVRSLTTNMVVCRHDLIYDINSLRLALKSPFEIPSFPTRQELESTIPDLLGGQDHLYPLPLCGTLRIPVGFDFTLYLSPLPDAVIISDDTVPFATVWREKCWFGCPGSITRGQYLIYDTCSNQMEIKHARRV